MNYHKSAFALKIFFYVLSSILLIELVYPCFSAFKTPLKYNKVKTEKEEIVANGLHIIFFLPIIRIFTHLIPILIWWKGPYNPKKYKNLNKYTVAYCILGVLLIFGFLIDIMKAVIYSMIFKSCEQFSLCSGNDITMFGKSVNINFFMSILFNLFFIFLMLFVGIILVTIKVCRDEYYYVYLYGEESNKKK